ncbi:SDR family NAD(P)-dependent oxidoreductase [Hydrogenophaga sp.]|uniref:SDR family NAD(P)-dependent oxidoreductase n=1 Tax=Hydrogenophaga sp. TaxID=1904254 RepID=UPI002616917A|nr:SDR family NAD(P)-dependent oxidoreductase [Hydrogenophaga sp.]MCW5656010.1 SDR family oxidoreductase [Hydrogenophaga sp.]
MDNAYLQQTFGLDGRTALITGSARGIGFAIARALGKAGARVVINDLRPQACAEAVASLGQEGIEARAICFDVSDEAAVQAGERELAQAGWHVDILINNAGNQNRKPLVEMSSAEWQQIMSVHVNGTFHCTRAFLPGMAARGFGRIVSTASVSGQATMPLIAAYSSAKAAMAAFMRAVAIEHGAQGITANAIAPGIVHTDFTVGLQQREGFEDYLRQAVPAGRWAYPEDIAPTVLFLVSPAASFINGQTLAIDGGMLARL